LVVSSYEARQEELLQENKGLSAALADLQSDYRALANKQAAAQQLQAAAVRQVVEDEDLQHVLRSSDAGQVQADLSAKMAAMKTKIEGVYDGPMQQV
jgi:type II secretory pathway component PulM